jgi:tRNA(Arg) A34 adenosine deaminase TadA
MASGVRPGQAIGCEPGLIDRLLGVIEHEIVPLTREGVRRGNKVFGAALLRKSDFSTVLAATNNETQNPLWHGEIHALKLLYEMPKEARPAPSEMVFLATHEPCTLCLSAITWSGYDKFYYLFSHEDSRDSFNIGHDLRILKAVFKLDPGEYARSNAYWTGYGIRDLVENCEVAPKDRFQGRIADLTRTYAEMSDVYQNNKAATDIPLR